MPQPEQKRRTYRDREPAAPAKGGGPSLGALAIAAIVLVAAFAALTGNIKLPQIQAQASDTPNAASLQNDYGAEMLEYVHPQYGFRLKYPAGYSVTQDQDGLKFMAMAQDGMPVIVYAFLLDGAYDDRRMMDFVNGAPTQTGGTNYSIESFGKRKFGQNTAYVVNSTQSNEVLDEKIIVTDAFVNCPYGTIMIEAGVPELSASEQKVVYAMLETLQCG